MADTNVTDSAENEHSNEDLADLAMGDDPPEPEGDDEESEKDESFWGSFKSYVPQARELEELKSSLLAKEKELANALASRKLQLEDLFDESVVKGMPVEDIEELAAALYFTVHPDKVDKEIAAGIKSKREQVAARRQREKEEADIRAKIEEAAAAREDADIRTYQAELKESIVDMADSIPGLMHLAGGNRAELSRLVFEEVMEAVEAGIAKTPDDIDPAKVLAGLERRASKVLGKKKQPPAPTRKGAIVKGTSSRPLRGIFAK